MQEHNPWQSNQMVVFYMLLLAYYESDIDESILKMYEKAKKYTFDTFPNPDKSINHGCGQAWG